MHTAHSWVGTSMSVHPMKPQPEAGPYLSRIDLVVTTLTPVVPRLGSQLQFTAAGVTASVFG